MLFLRKLHKWLGLLVAVQLLLWAVSGVVFAWLDHENVSAEHGIHAAEPATLAPPVALAEPHTWLDQYGPERIYEVRLTTLLDQWLWRVELADRVELRRADGTPFVLDEQWTRRLALGRYAGEGRIEKLAFLPKANIESRGNRAVWQVQFDDPQRTTMYFAAADGQLVAVRNDTWRLFDVFWMLHTMDYAGRDDFNNPLVITAATAALWLSISGMLLLLRSFRRTDFELIGRLRSNS